MYSNPFIGMYSSGRFEFGGKFYHNSVWVYLVYIFATTENEDKENMRRTEVFCQINLIIVVWIIGNGFVNTWWLIFMHISGLITRYYFAANFVASVPFIWKIHKKINKPRMNVISKTNENKRAGEKIPSYLMHVYKFHKVSIYFYKTCLHSKWNNKQTCESYLAILFVLVESEEENLRAIDRGLADLGLDGGGGCG